MYNILTMIICIVIILPFIRLVLTLGFGILGIIFRIFRGVLGSFHNIFRRRRYIRYTARRIHYKH